MKPAHIDTLVRQLIGGDPAAAAAILTRAATSTEPTVLTVAALLDPGRPELLIRAVGAARTRPDRQLTALAAAHLAGDRDLVSALAREHLLDHPDSVLAAWIASGARSHSDNTAGAPSPAAIPPPAGSAPAITPKES